jgi:hypothetical protein
VKISRDMPSKRSENSLKNRFNSKTFKNKVAKMGW